MIFNHLGTEGVLFIFIGNKFVNLLNDVIKILVLDPLWALLKNF